MKTPEQFWSRVLRLSPNDCWEWQGSITSSGYGNLSWHGSPVQAHRLAYYLSIGGVSLHTGFRVPGVARKYRRFVLHRCDNRKCCNPAHLFLGSMRSNLLDAYAKGRKKQPRSELTPAEVRRIRGIYNAGGATQVELAAKYGVSQRAISLIVRNETYKDVT
jgi:DNA-binding XRE family transcriptional regulator